MIKAIFVSFVKEVDKQAAPEKCSLSDVIDEIRDGKYAKEIQEIRSLK